MEPHADGTWLLVKYLLGPVRVTLKCVSDISMLLAMATVSSVDKNKILGTDRIRSQNQKADLFLLLRIKALDWEAATVGVGCNPLIASLDAFYARWKCTRGLHQGAGRVPAWRAPYLPHHGQFEASLALEGRALSG